jgi:hypothetical protein
MPRQIPALQIVALFAMVMPALVALMQVWLPARLVESLDNLLIGAATRTRKTIRHRAA